VTKGFQVEIRLVVFLLLLLLLLRAAVAAVGFGVVLSLWFVQLVYEALSY
jgi:hypothetical protein